MQLATFLTKPVADPAGLRSLSTLPWALPYHLAPRDCLRMVEDLYDLLHDMNVLLDSKGYERLEELLDPAGFSGLISRSVVDGIAKFSRALVKNAYHNGYPDLLPRGVYPGNSVARGAEGGLEVKASRYESSWQSHGPRAGWFCVVQFVIDKDEAKAVKDRDPTKALAVMLAELEEDDWSWQPAQPGRIRSGTASIKPRGEAKLRSGAVWVDPVYEPTHTARLHGARVSVFRGEADSHVAGVLAQATAAMSAQEIADTLAPSVGVPAVMILSSVKASLRRLIATGAAVRVARSLFAPPTLVLTP